MTIANLRQFTLKNKPIIYIGIFVKLYNWKNHKQVYEIYGIIELEKMCTLTIKNFYNLSIHQIIKISLVPCSAHMVSGDQNKFVIYINNYID